MQVSMTIIGGGILGLTIAYELSKKYPGLDMVILEKEHFPGEHASSRNSAVIHSGIYYPTGSLKHQLCIEGNRLWSSYASELNFKVNKCGKYLISTSADENEILEKYYDNALKNGVEGISWCDTSELSEFVHVKKAFFSKNTSIIDVPTVIKELEKNIFNKNIPILKDTKVLNLKKIENSFSVETTREKFESKFVINAAGCFAPDIRKILGLKDLESYFVKGHYLKLTKKFYNDSLIYPVPTPDLKGLGVHTSFATDGLVRFGPNTCDVKNYNFNFEAQTLEAMYESISRVFPNILVEDLAEDYCGIRPKIKYQGKIYSDFWIKGEAELGLKGYVELCGIESPGLTAAPAIARYLIEDILPDFS